MMIINNELEVRNIPDKIITKTLEELNFDKLSINVKDNKLSYEYLIGMPIKSLSLENKNKIEKEYLQELEKLENYRKLSISDIWLSELDELEDEYLIWYENVLKEFSSISSDKTKTKNKSNKKITKKSIKK